MTRLDAPNPAFADSVRDSFNRQDVMRTLGIDLVSIEPGRVVLHMPFCQKLTQQHDFIHAGVMATALDSACGYAAYSLMPEGSGVLTIEFKTNLLAPAAGKHFRFEGRVVKPGRTIMVSEGQAFAINETDEKLVSTMTATLMVMPDTRGIQG